MKFENLTKAQLVKLAYDIEGNIRAMLWTANLPHHDDWSKGRTEAFEQSARWLNETIAKYIDQTQHKAPASAATAKNECL
ncbi:MAG: hypothetical protein WA125_17010 [Desulfosporosinus sp.]